MNNKVTFIIGAGASKELGIPTGTELKQKISGLLRTLFSGSTERNPPIENAILSAFPEMRYKQNLYDEYTLAARRICTAMPLSISIDNFIDAHQGDAAIELCGKLAITQAILAEEKNSILYINQENRETSIDFSNAKIQNCYLTPLFARLTENCTFENLAARLSSVSFIVFNYDRCIEHFLFHAIQTYYGVTPTESEKMLKNIHIYHPYGSVGPLEWQEKNVRGVPFGAQPNTENFLHIAKDIKTFTEGTNPDSSEIRSIHYTLELSSHIVFLGFAFHQLNMNLLTPIRKTPAEIPKKFFATAYGLSENDSEIIKRSIASLGPTRSTLEHVKIRNDLTCYQLFNEYTRGISLLS